MLHNTLRHQSRGTQLYVSVITAAGATVVCHSVYDLASGDIGWNWAILAMLTLVSGSATVALPSLPASVSVSETFVFTSVILFGSSAGTVTVALDAAVISFWSYRKGQPAYKILFNVCALPLTIWLAAHLFFILAGMNGDGRLAAALPLFRNPDPLSIRQLLWPLFVFTVVYFSLNSWVIAFAIALEKRLPPFRIWRDNFLPLSLNYFGGASVAALFVSYTNDLDYTFLAIIVPLLIVLYLTFATSIGRVADANKHLTELNTLYMSTIETLAMAIDAKDQVTHGHIRRVQLSAIRLANELGVVDSTLIRAIEAAALLHDMGKLAVPEYILNKPGPLTAAEFEKMKLHAAVGAEILSSINFPYPVVPIVRHHHESWDGNGYPDGLKGSAIPLGARILSVVDCFDALTSARPYRPALTDSAALEILVRRRGSMYDPLVVDTFVNAHSKSGFATEPATSHVEGISAITRASNMLADPSSARTTAGEAQLNAEHVRVLCDIVAETVDLVALKRVGEITFDRIADVVPPSTFVLYVHDSVADELVTHYATGPASQHFSGIRIARGHKLTGWVAANHKSILNADPILDLEGAILQPHLRSCVSVPIMLGDDLVGVLTAYSTTANAYNDQDRRFLEFVSERVGPTINRCLDHDRLSNLPDTAVTQASAEFSRLRFDRTLQVAAGSTLSVISLKLSRFACGNDDPEHTLQFPSIISAIRYAIKSGDVLLRSADDEFIILLPLAGIAVANVVAQRIAGKLDILSTTWRIAAMVDLGVATVPDDGKTLGELIASAEAHRLSGTGQTGHRTSIH